MFLECPINIGHHLLDNAFLDVYGLQEPWESRIEDSVHIVCIVELHKGGIHMLGLKVAEERGSNGPHALDVTTCLTSQRK